MKCRICDYSVTRLNRGKLTGPQRMTQHWQDAHEKEMRALERQGILVNDTLLDDEEGATLAWVDEVGPAPTPDRP